MKKRATHQYIVRRLEAFVGSHARIAAESGVPQNTISRIYRGGSVPLVTTADALLDWFDQHDRAAARAAARSAVGRAVGGGGRRRAAAALSEQAKQG